MRYSISIIPTACAVLLLLSPSPTVFSQDTAGVIKRSVGKAAEAGFSEVERQIIEEYLGKRAGRNAEKDDSEQSDRQARGGKPGNKGLPPGLAKRDSLPPGLAMQLERNGTLPPGLAKRDLPGDLQNRLSSVPEGYERSIIEDTTVVLVEKANGRIADIVREVVTGSRDRPAIRD